jgi:hypothetical protein
MNLDGGKKKEKHKEEEEEVFVQVWAPRQEGRFQLPRHLMHNSRTRMEVMSTSAWVG